MFEENVVINEDSKMKVVFVLEVCRLKEIEKWLVDVIVENEEFKDCEEEVRSL